MKIVIVGGVAGGATAAARLRRLSETAEIVIFERTGYVSYANCGLPYYVGGVIEDEEALTLSSPEHFRARYRVDVRTGSEVTEIDRDERCVTVREAASGREYREPYDFLLLAPGARPRIPAWYTGGEGCFTLRTVEDTVAVRRFCEERTPRTATVVGGGFVGLEMAENLARRGIAVTVLQRGESLLSPLDADMAAHLHAHLRSAGLSLRFGAEVTEMKADGAGIRLILGSGEEIASELLLLTVGIKPESGLAERAGLSLGVGGSVAVNERMQTSDPHIYAVGDVIETQNCISGEAGRVALAGPANRQARIAADNMMGIASTYRGVQGSFIIGLFGMTAAATGLSERELRRLGLAYHKVILSPSSHAGYYPGARVMTVKLLFARDGGRILGASIVGYDGVDKRIDVLATALAAGMRARELADLELAYAPPYSSAKDPVNYAGYIAENIERGLVRQWYLEELPEIRKAGLFLLDTRTVGEYARGHAEGFVNIPLDTLRDRLAELPRNREIAVMCQSGLRSYLATRILTENGFACRNFAGGYRYYATVTAEEEMRRTSAPCGADL
jgi:NADPH-dependent 2,4-dienoyl-CoA reductase/sulfur reductase-like enzyme/rhodanese-related sulfurtransferase